MNFIVYDIECTCWQGKPPGMIQETIEIGAFKIDDYREVTGRFCKFIKPMVNPILSPFCKDLTSITQEDIFKAGSFPKVIDQFLDWTEIIDEEDYVLCSWGSFDKTQLASDCRLHRLETEWTEKHINLKQQYQAIRKMRQPPGLHRAVINEGFEFTGTQHRGISDAENLAKLFLKYFDRWVF